MMAAMKLTIELLVVDRSSHTKIDVIGVRIGINSIPDVTETTSLVHFLKTLILKLTLKVSLFLVFWYIKKVLLLIPTYTLCCLSYKVENNMILDVVQCFSSYERE